MRCRACSAIAAALRAYEAISSGLIAIGAGDIAAAQQVRRAGQPHRARRTAGAAADARKPRSSPAIARRPSAPSTPWPIAPTPRRSGCTACSSRRGAATIFASAQAFAEEAARTAPSLGWAGRAVLEFRCATGDWAGALDLLERNKATLDKATYRRQRAVLLTARALAIEGQRPRHRQGSCARSATARAELWFRRPRMAGRLLAEGGSLRKAGRVIDKAWRANPHPDLAEAYARLALRRHRARPAQAHRSAGEAGAGQYRRRAGAGARRARCAGIRQGACRA